MRFLKCSQLSQHPTQGCPSVQSGASMRETRKCWRGSKSSYFRCRQACCKEAQQQASYDRVSNNTFT
eukprot:6197755-Pleurochrysis_carterae.AAC.2